MALLVTFCLVSTSVYGYVVATGRFFFALVFYPKFLTKSIILSMILLIINPTDLDGRVLCVFSKMPGFAVLHVKKV